MKRIIISILSIALFACGAMAQPQIRSQWEGKRVAFLGDSITDASQIGFSNNIWWNNLKDILGIEPYVYAVSGERMDHIQSQAEKMEAELGQGMDAILVFIGTNDWNNSVPLGEWYTVSEQPTIANGEDVVRKYREFIYDNSTFRGRCNIALRHLKTRFPDKQIIFLTPVHRALAHFGGKNYQTPETFANGAGLFLDDYVEVLKEMGNVWAVPVIDLNSISGLYPIVDEQAPYYRNVDTDRLHPGTSGQRRMAEAIAYRLLGYPASFSKYIALSFDDGPNTSTTAEVLDVLEANDVTASFFIIGRNVDKQSRKMMERAVAMGCEIENHSWTHQYMTRLTPEQIKEEVSKTSELIVEVTGREPVFFRPPYINVNEVMHENIGLCFISGRGYRDWEPQVTAQERIDDILANTRDGDIMLLHDMLGNVNTVEALKVVIPELKRRGFTFVTVSELFELRGAMPKANNGVVYSNAFTDPFFSFRRRAQR